MNNGLLLYGTSSSFNTNSNEFNFKVFPESSAQNQSNFLRVNPYTEKEVDFIVNYIKEYFKSKDCILQRFNTDDIFRLTGYVPRHIKGKNFLIFT